MKTYLLIASLAVLSACNTVAGVGQDVQNAGQVMTGEAREQQGACINGMLADGTPC
ncbi:entericidin A/B family lipoprotein [Pelagovum pacificum]|uniref:Entericidin A/B family lipoprotein n=1 Tax=Pelagovum pacificum TaxID=2588711 RepID=A0A5C5GFU6_9RHOB|nr:entericidin A/B family lipoprotein [Pelagovum pacificum]QQA43290.1 entericidin A/B family lipoprotein [Pelagovum pacificum]TNY33573.1 entericidin A/B family lipoprotein [Pelagovum pacificum]